MTIFIPVAGYLVLFNENLLHYIELSRELFGVQQVRVDGLHAAGAAHVSTRLLLLYFGLCLVALASAIYAWRCPPEIKTYNSPTDYIAGTAESVSLIEMGAIENKLKQGDEVSRLGIAEISDWHKGRPTVDSLEEIRIRGAEYEAAVLDLYFQLQDRSHPMARLAALVCYAIGFVALAVPSVEVFAKVSAMLARVVFVI